jgi:type I restriction enzyme S subunit
MIESQSVTLGSVVDLNPRESILPGASASYLEMAALPVNSRRHDAPRLRAAAGGARFRDGDTLFARITPCLETLSVRLK